MNTDFRITIGLTSHPKTIKLMRRCGDRGFFCLVNLWSWVAQFKPDGNLSGLDDESIEIAAGWMGEEGAFVAQLSAIGFLDGECKGYTLHDWKEHNDWASGAEERSGESRMSKLAQVNRSAFEYLQGQGITSISKEEYYKSKENDFSWMPAFEELVQCDSSGPQQRPQSAPIAVAERSQANTSGPSPSPSPTTYPTPPSARAREGSGEPFCMVTDWQPTEFFPTLAETAGFKPPPPEELETALREFRTYWLTQKRKRTAHEWDLAFIKAIQSGFTTPRARAPNKGSKQQGKPTTYAQELARQRNEGAKRLKEKYGIGGKVNEQGAIPGSAQGCAGSLEHGTQGSSA